MLTSKVIQPTRSFDLLSNKYRYLATNAVAWLNTLQPQGSFVATVVQILLAKLSFGEQDTCKPLCVTLAGNDGSVRPNQL